MSCIVWSRNQILIRMTDSVSVCIFLCQKREKSLFFLQNNSKTGCSFKEELCWVWTSQLMMILTCVESLIWGCYPNKQKIMNFYMDVCWDKTHVFKRALFEIDSWLQMTWPVKTSIVAASRNIPSISDGQESFCAIWWSRRMFRISAFFLNLNWPLFDNAESWRAESWKAHIGKNSRFYHLDCLYSAAVFIRWDSWLGFMFTA